MAPRLSMPAIEGARMKTLGACLKTMSRQVGSATEFLALLKLAWTLGFLVSLLLILLLLPEPACGAGGTNAAEIYVSPTGSDTNDGTLFSPYLTLTNAIARSQSGGIIHIGAGTNWIYDADFSFPSNRTLAGIPGASMIASTNTAFRLADNDQFEGLTWLLNLKTNTPFNQSWSLFRVSTNGTSQGVVFRDNIFRGLTDVFYIGGYEITSPTSTHTFSARFYNCDFYSVWDTFVLQSSTNDYVGMFGCNFVGVPWNTDTNINLFTGPHIGFGNFDFYGGGILASNLLGGTGPVGFVCPFGSGAPNQTNTTVNLFPSYMQFVSNAVAGIHVGIGPKLSCQLNIGGAIDPALVRLPGLAANGPRIRPNFVEGWTNAPADTTALAVAIKSPTNGPAYRTSISSLNLGGSASDNVGVVQVTWSNDRGGGGLARGTSQWAVEGIGLQSGLNVITVTAQDAAGNTNTGTLLVTYTVSSNLTVVVNGPGVVIPNYNARVLRLGGNYSMTARENRPGPQYVFSNWMDGAGMVLTNGATLKFTMQPNLLLQANFVPNPFIPMKGVYTGLFYDPNGVRHESSGFFTLVLTGRGTYSAHLQLQGRRLSFSGYFDVTGKADRMIRLSQTNSLTLTLALASTGDGDRVTGTIGNGQWLADLVADRAVFSAPGDAGRYTMIIPGNPDPAAGPGGDGFGLVRIGASGRIQMAGVLADGTRVAQGSTISMSGRWPLYVSLYGGQGSILSWITFTNAPADDLNGVLSWIKPANPQTRYYPGGFTTGTTAFGSVYNRPVGMTSRILNFTNAQLVLNDGNLVQNITNHVALNLDNQVSNLSANHLSLVFTPSWGLFRGSAVNPATAKPIPFIGAVLQKGDAGHGFFLGTNQSGRVYFGQ